jgi:UDP-glucose 4-epimerase
MVVPRFVAAALKGEPLSIYGDGRQTRTFVDVRDTVEAIRRVMQVASPQGRIFNIGGDREISIEALADLVLATTGSRAGKRHFSYEEAYGEPIDDMMRRCPRIDRLRAVVGPEWPRHRLEDTLRSLVAAVRV